MIVAYTTVVAATIVIATIDTTTIIERIFYAHFNASNQLNQPLCGALPRTAL